MIEEKKLKSEGKFDIWKITEPNGTFYDIYLDDNNVNTFRNLQSARKWARFMSKDSSEEALKYICGK